LTDKSSKKNLNWTELGFDYIRTDYRYSAIYENGEWNQGSLTEDDQILIHEGAPTLHYAQQCFEGMKALTTANGDVCLFRPSLNWERMNSTAPRLLMPAVPRELFLGAIEETVRANYPWIPPYGSGAALYVRPMLIGVGENLGLKPAEKYEFRVFVSPVGPYYKDSGMAMISLAVSEFDRAAPNGTGKYKAGANYAGGLLATLNAQGIGANEALYLDSANNKFIDEAGSANIVVFTKDEKLITPSSDAILPSITRRSIMELAEIELKLTTEERPIDLRSEFQNFSEMAACGTAAVLAPVGKIWFDEKWHSMPGNENSDSSVMEKLYELLVGIQRGEIEDKFEWLHSIDMGH